MKLIDSLAYNINTYSMKVESTCCLQDIGGLYKFSSPYYYNKVFGRLLMDEQLSELLSFLIWINEKFKYMTQVAKKMHSQVHYLKRCIVGCIISLNQQRLTAALRGCRSFVFIHDFSTNKSMLGNIDKKVQYEKRADKAMCIKGLCVVCVSKNRVRKVNNQNPDSPPIDPVSLEI